MTKIKMPKKFKEWEYDCKVLRVIDGDTIDVMIDCGFKVFRKERIRLYGVDTPESRTRDLEEKKKGLECKEFIQEKLLVVDAMYIVVAPVLPIKITIQTLKQGKFGRYLAMVYYTDSKGRKICINQELIDTKRATEYYGGKR